MNNNLPTTTSASQITFKPSNVFVEYHLRMPDGKPVVLTETQVEDLMKLEFVDAADEGGGNRAAEIVFNFEHPMDTHPASLLEMQKIVLEVIDVGWDAYVAAEDTGNTEPEAPEPGAEMGEQSFFIPSED